MRDRLRRFVRHLRLQFQSILAPIFLLGYELTDAPPSLSFLFLFLLMHVGLYGGATAYNSYYNRDEGPIGGMKQSLAVDAGAIWLPNRLPPVPCAGGDWPAAGVGHTLRRGAAPPVDVAHPDRLWSLSLCHPDMVETIRQSDSLSESRLVIRHQPRNVKHVLGVTLC